MIDNKIMQEYRIEISSDVDYEYLVSSIYISDVFVALLWYNHHENSITVDVVKDFGSATDKISIDFDIFIEALNAAKIELIRSVDLA